MPRRNGRWLSLAVLTTLAGCAAEGGLGETDRTDAGDPSTAPRDGATEDGTDDPPSPSCESPSCDDTPPGARSTTDEQLDAFYSEHGGRDAFPSFHVQAVETFVYAEDEIVAGDYAAARERVDAFLSDHPPTDPLWTSGFGPGIVGWDGTNLSYPIAYPGLRMIEEVAHAVRRDTADSSTPITLTIVLARCAEGMRPTDPDLREGEPVSLELHPALTEDGHAIVRQSLRLFRRYVWAITGGELRLELSFQPLDTCLEVGFEERGGRPWSGLRDYRQPLRAVPDDVVSDTDMWWVLYPSNVPSEPAFDDTGFVTGGMGLSERGAPVFIIDDLWLVRKPPTLGTGPYTAIERRVYLPQWLQHEFFHHLFRLWPELGLEETAHQWFDRGTWPSEFEGKWEADYYAEALEHRLYDATPSIARALQVAREEPEDLGLTTADVVGSYERTPIENPWHEVEIVPNGGGLLWTNAASVSWPLHSGDDGTLRTGPECPYGEQELELMAGGEPPAITGIRFNGELYVRR